MNEQQKQEMETPSFLDFLLTIYKYKVMLIVTVFVTVVSAFLYSSKHSSENYEYKATISAGTRIYNGEIKSIDKITDLVVKINESYIPEMTKATSTNHKSRVCQLSAKKIDYSTDIIIIKGVGTSEENIYCVDTINTLISKIEKREDALLEKQRNSIIQKKKSFLSMKDKYNEEKMFQEAKLQILRKREDVLTKQLDVTQKSLQELIDLRSEIFKNNSSSVYNDRYITITLEINNTQKYLLELEDKFIATIDMVKSSTLKKMSDANRKYNHFIEKVLGVEIELLEFKALSVLKEPHAVHINSRIPNWKIMIAAVFAGVLTGILLILLRLLIRNHNRPI